MYKKNNLQKFLWLLNVLCDNVSVENPDVEFIRPCNLCPHMKRINLPKILESLMLNIHEVKIDQKILEKARLPIERMLNL